MRIQLEIPESEMASALPLLAWRNRVLKVTVEPQAQDAMTQLLETADA